MSLESWRAVFYPTPAQSLRRATWRECLQHSLTKWEGLREEQLKAHEVEWSRMMLSDCTGDYLYLDGNTCACCWRTKPRSKCALCKLDRYQVCWGQTWFQILETHNVAPMIKALRAALRRLRRRTSE